jgi:hypothetical protein
VEREQRVNVEKRRFKQFRYVLKVEGVEIELKKEKY